jgi:cell division septation protein DedD
VSGSVEMPAPAAGESAEAKPEAPEKDVKLTFYTSLTASQEAPVNLPVVVPEAQEKKSTVKKKDQFGVVQPTDGGGPSSEMKAEPGKTPVRTVPVPGMKASPDSAPTVSLQVGSFSSEGSARLLHQRLEKAGYKPVVVVPAEIPGKGTWYRVRITGIASREAAEKLRRRLAEREGLQTMIVSR